MREYNKRFSDFEKLPTHKAMNSDLMFLFGITMKDFLAALVVFLGICVLPGFLTPFIAVLYGALVIGISKKIRTTFPKKYFFHLLWAYGILDSKGLKNPFKSAKSRLVSLQP